MLDVPKPGGGAKIFRLNVPKTGGWFKSTYIEIKTKI